MQFLNIEIDHNFLHRITLIGLFVYYSFFGLVYSVFGYYTFAINRSKGMIAQFLTYVIISASFILFVLQFQVFSYSMYIRFSKLNSFVE